MKAFAGVEIPESLQDAVRPDRTALVVYDMQVGILQQLPNGKAVLEKVLTVLDAARSANVRVIFMRHMSLPKRLSGAFQLRQMMVWQRKTSPDDVHPWFLRSNPGFELAPELSVRDDEAVLDKITMSAFEGTPLSIALRDCGLDEFCHRRHRHRDRHRADRAARLGPGFRPGGRHRRLRRRPRRRRRARHRQHALHGRRNALHHGRAEGGLGGLRRISAATLARLSARSALCYKVEWFQTAEMAHQRGMRIVLDDRSRLPWRFFGRLTTAALTA